eukprot:scaffold358_cov256-Pinguiococcus_pyrenoidosus.AAC.2
MDPSLQLAFSSLISCLEACSRTEWSDHALPRPLPLAAWCSPITFQVGEGARQRSRRPGEGASQARSQHDSGRQSQPASLAPRTARRQASRQVAEMPWSFNMRALQRGSTGGRF